MLNNKLGIIIQITTPTDNHLISSVIKMHYHLSQTIVHITLSLILMKQQEVWQQVPASIEKTKNILLFSQTTIYNKYKCINKTCFKMKNTKLTLLFSQTIMYLQIKININLPIIYEVITLNIHLKCISLSSQTIMYQHIK